MNILFVCHRFPYPPIRGGKIRPFNIIRHLHGQGHKVWVASLARSDEEVEQGRGIEPYCHAYMVEKIGAPQALVQMLACLPTPAPSSIGYFYSRSLGRRIRETVERCDIDLIVAHCSSVAPYVASVGSIPKILDFGDMDSQKWLTYATFRGKPLAWGYWLEGTKLARKEKQLARMFDCCTCTTRAELETLTGYGVAGAYDWFPNGVDFEYFQPSGAAYDPDKIAFVGRMDYYPNQEAVLRFCREVFPGIVAARPGTRFVIVGASPPEKIRRLESIPGVSVTGSVPDVRPHVQDAAITVAPIDIARGTQNKIIESIAMGVPVVSSPAAAKGVDVEPGEHMLVSDSSSGFSASVLSVLGDPALRERLSASGLERVRRHHDWAGSMQRFDGIVRETLDAARAGAP